MKQSLGPKKLVAYPTPAWALCSYDSDGKPNVMTVAWAGICCSKPFCLAVCMRKATYSYDNVMERKAFTVNIPSEKYVKEMDFFGSTTGKKTDKFADTGLTPVRAEHVDAPYIEEFPVVYECKLTHTLEIGLHTLLVGEVVDLKADPEVMGEKEVPDIEKVKPIIFGPTIRTYHGIGEYLGKAYSIGKEIKPELFTKKESE